MLVAELISKRFSARGLCSAAFTYGRGSRSGSRSSRSVASSTCLVIPLILFTTPVLATEYECRSGGDIRQIRVDYPGVKHLCEVSVNSGRSSREVKWYADVESTFCSEKIVELIGKYENQWGYTCEEWPDHDGIDELSPI